MGLAACTTLISSLSLKQTDWPLYLHEPSSGSTAHLQAANIWLHGPSHTALVTLANQLPVQGAPAAKPVHCLHIHLSCHPTGFFFFSVSPPFFPLHPVFSVWIATFFYSSPSVAIVCLALGDLPLSSSSRASFIQEMKTERRRAEEEERQQVVLTLEEEKEGLTSRCATLQADLDQSERQAKSQQDQRDAAQARVKVWKRGQIVSDTLLHRKSFQKMNTVEFSHLTDFYLSFVVQNITNLII